MVAQIIDHPYMAGVIPTPYIPDPALLAIVEIIRDGLIRDHHVRLHNFGTFRLRWNQGRRVKHPSTGEYITAPPAPKITFTPAKQLREWIEPNRKPVIPLEVPTSLDIDAIKPGSNHLPETETIASPQREATAYALHETIQDILDEEYSLTESNSGIAATNKDPGTTVENKSNKKWSVTKQLI